MSTERNHIETAADRRQTASAGHAARVAKCGAQSDGTLFRCVQKDLFDLARQRGIAIEMPALIRRLSAMPKRCSDTPPCARGRSTGNQSARSDTQADYDCGQRASIKTLRRCGGRLKRLSATSNRSQTGNAAPASSARRAKTEAAVNRGPSQVRIICHVPSGASFA